MSAVSFSAAFKEPTNSFPRPQGQSLRGDFEGESHGADAGGSLVWQQQWWTGSVCWAPLAAARDPNSFCGAQQHMTGKKAVAKAR
jgi:hypothetical protein